jgi:hypothetical protein
VQCRDFAECTWHCDCKLASTEHDFWYLSFFRLQQVGRVTVLLCLSGTVASGESRRLYWLHIASCENSWAHQGGYRDLFLATERLCREAAYPLPSSAEVTKDWSRASSSIDAFTMCTGKTWLHKRSRHVCLVSLRWVGPFAELLCGPQGGDVRVLSDVQSMCGHGQPTGGGPSD